ncbi:MAG: type II secretion system protein GspC [Thalassotalea sp.]
MQLPNNLSTSLVLLAKLPQQKIAQAVSFLLLAYIAYLIALLTWDIATPKPTFNYAFTHQVNQNVETKTTAIDVTKIKSLHLFGEYNAKKIQTVSEEVKDAPETRLNLTLAGVVASPDKAIAIAVIENGGQQNTLGIGDKIDGTRAILEQVFVDRVIIKHAGKLETLMLDGLKFSKTIEQAPSASNQNAIIDSARTVDNRNNTLLQERVRDIKSSIADDPGKLTDYLRFSEKKQNGETVGYILMPGKDPDFFKASGLQSGDVAVQMNGYDLTSTFEAVQALQALKTESEVALWVDRDGEVTEILFSIEN